MTNCARLKPEITAVYMYKFKVCVLQNTGKANCSYWIARPTNGQNETSRELSWGCPLALCIIQIVESHASP